MMKSFFLPWLCLALSAARVSGQVYTSPQDGSLVDCGKEKVVMVERSQSPDGHYAAGWTLRPKGDKVPVDWTSYDRNDPLAIIKRYGLNSNPTAEGDDPAKSDYLLLNGVLDLAAKTFTPLPTEDPWFPYKTHGSLRVLWSEGGQSPRYAAIGNSVGSNHSENTIDLWLVQVRVGGVQVVDLKPAADKAVGGFLHKRHRRNAGDYESSFGFDDVAKTGKGLRSRFTKNALTLHFSADLTQQEKSADSGYVNFALPKGNVSGVVPDEAKRRESSK